MYMKCSNVPFSRKNKKQQVLQFIGSEAASSNTWLWGWENINGFPEKIMQTAIRTKEIGELWKFFPLIKRNMSGSIRH